MRKILLPLTLIVLLSCLFVLGQNRNPKNTANISKQNNQNQDIQSPTSIPSPAAQPSTTSTKTEANTLSDEDKDKIFWDKWSSIGTLASAVTSFIVLVVVIIQAKISNDQLAQNERAISSSERQATIADNSLIHAKEVFDKGVRDAQFAQNRKVKSVIVGLQTEINTLLEIYEGEFKAEIDEISEGKAFDYKYPISADYFALYSANASLIGEIPDDELRSLIIKTYLKGRSVIDTHMLNNKLIEEFEAVSNQRLHHNYDGELEANFNNAQSALDSYGINIKDNYLELVELVNALNSRVEAVIPMLPSE